MLQPLSTISSGMCLGAKRSLRRSVSSALTFNPIWTTYHFCASSKAEALNNDGNDLDDSTAIYAIDDLAHSLACRQMIGEKQEIDTKGIVARITNIERI